MVRSLSKRLKLELIILALYLVAIIASLTVFLTTFSEHVTNTYIWDGTTATSYASGSGTVSSPYLISNGAELAYFRDMVDNGYTYAGSYFQLTNDIDLNGETWDPIGDYDSTFRGIFDGAGHTISNFTISTGTTVPTSSESWGFFASLGSGSTYAIVKNVVFDAITININYNGSSSSSSTARGFAIGTVVGIMYNHSEVANVIVKNTTIATTGTLRIRSYGFLAYIGGIAGYAVNSTSSTTDPGSGSRYVIDNCLSDVDINSTIIGYQTSSSYYYYYSQHAIGGIIGGIRSQPQYPTNSLYTGSITGNGFIGPIFAALRNANASTSTTNFTSIYAGTSAGTVTPDNIYYYNYSVNGTSYTYNHTAGTSLMTSVQGVNQGTYTSNMTTILSIFNSSTYDGIVWTYSNGEFGMQSRLTTSINESPDYTFNLSISDYYNTGTYTSTWYVNGVLTTATNNTLAITPSFSTSYVVKVITYDGTYYTLTQFTVPKLEIYFNFSYNSSTGILTASYAGNGTNYLDMSSFTTTWTHDDISGLEHDTVGTNTLSISAETGADYTITATNGTYTFTGSYTVGTRTVVYLNYSSGNDSNTCLTSSSPCKTMSGAYGKLSSSGTRNSNIIVVIGTYSNTSYFNSATATTYAKSATLTGTYQGTSYSGVLYFEGYNNGYKYITGDTTFEYLTFYGSNSQTYFYLQGYDLTMGNGIYMTSYATSNTNQGLITGSAPAFHIFGGWLQYDYSTLPRNNSTITIKSGSYGRIIMGGSNGTASTSTMYQYTSHNFTGSSYSDMFTSTLNVDIENSTNTNYTYDINLIVGGSAWGNMYANMTENIYSGSVGRVLGASIGDSSYTLSDWSYPLNTYIGYSKINVYGGSIQEVYGGSLGRNMGALSGTSSVQCDSYFYGTVDINVSGGTIAGNIYGAGAGGVSGYSSSSSDTYKSYGQNVATSVNVNITGGTVSGNIYGGGYGYTEYLTATSIAPDGGALYGDSNINLSGGTVSGNIYGAGKGYTGYSGRTALAQTSGTSTVTVSDNASLNGNIYGGGEGASGYTDNAKMTGDTIINIARNLSVNVYGGGNIAPLVGDSTISVNSGTLTGTVYGGGNVGEVSGISNIYIYAGTLANVYGGGYSAGITTTNIRLNGGNISSVYGGGYSANATTTNIILNGSTVTNLYGGSNTSGTVGTSNITSTTGTVDYIYGGNNAGGTTTNSNITINGGTINTAIYGGGNLASGSHSSLILSGSSNKVPNIYGGGKSASVTSTNIQINGISATNVFGGSDSSGSVSTSTIRINSGNCDYVYGGNNAGGTTTTSNIYSNGGVVQNIYGGGKQTNIDSTYVYLQGGTAVNIFGGSNTSGSVGTSNITTTSGNATNIYGGNNAGGTTTTSNVTISGGTISLAVYGGGYSAVTTNTNVTLNSTSSSIPYVYGGGNAASTSTVHVNIHGGTALYVFGGSNLNGTITQSTIAMNGGNITNLFGGNNQGGTMVTSNVNVSGGTVNYAYGGNNAGGSTTNANLNITSGNINYVYGGGKSAITGNTTVTVNGATINYDVYGGGDAAGITNDTAVNILAASINGNVFGGGNDGSVGSDTSVYFHSSNCLESIYAGGNGTTAIVYGNTLVNIDGTSQIDGSVFGGGNAATTGIDSTNNSTGIVNIVGGYIDGNVYGGANTSVLYGTSYVNIGYLAVNNTSLTKGDIIIDGTVFGGGEANASGSESYDFSFISVTNGTNVTINAAEHTNFNILGSIFGSGNASSTSGTSTVTIKNYGTYSSYRTNVSIQRATTVVLDNSAIELTGATDRTNEYSSVLFSISRVDELKLKNGSTLFLKNGTNLLKKLTSAVDISGTETKAAVTINSTTGTVTKNVDNRIYMYQGKNMNIATNENITAYGEVSGMTFFGLYTHDRNEKVLTAMYNKSYTYGSAVSTSEVYYFTSGSYVLGAHQTNQNTTIDGFYSNYANDDNDEEIVQNYITPTPDDSSYYMWYLGEVVSSYDVSLTASKYSTLGTYELPLLNYTDGNTTFTIVGFNDDDLDSSVSLVSESDIPRIASNSNDANTNLGLTIKSGNTGWITIGSTEFYTSDTNSIGGTTDYLSENSTSIPSLIFYLYHSKNISSSANLGTVVISLIVITPVDALNNEVQRLNINVTINRALYSTNDYEGTITTGKQYEMFASSAVNITSKSSFSSYFSLFANSSTSIYKTGYHHTLVSTYVFPENTKITMIDFAGSTEPEYYYYIVTAADVVSATTEYNLYGEASYNISKFIRMGSTDTSSNYNDSAKNAVYYNSSGGYAQEEFLFQFDFSQSNITSNVSGSILFELRDSNDQTIINVLGAIISTMEYNLYYNNDASIDVTASLSDTILYGGDSVNLNITTNFLQNIISTNTIIDTNYYDKKLGLKISIYDSSNNLLNGTNLMGLSFKYNGITYYPNLDGSVRISISPRVANVSSTITINSNKNTIASGLYTIKVESFGSPDGIYYGLTPSDSTTVNLNIVDMLYGLSVSTDDENVIVDSDTGYNLNGNNTFLYTVNYSSVLTNPKIYMSLERRNYDETYSLNYDVVNLQDYVTDTLTTTEIEDEYLLTNSPTSVMHQYLYLKNNLPTGTYRLYFKLYNGSTFVGSVYKYLIIK